MENNEMNLAEVIERLATLETEVRESSDVEFVKASTEEKRALLERKAELEAFEKRCEDAEKLENDEVPAEEVEVVENTEEKTEVRNMEFTTQSAEFRSAWVKNLQGKSLNEVEERAIAQAGVDGAIPDVVADKFIEKIKKVAPLLGKITLLQAKGNIKFTVEGVRDAAAKHTEGADITAGGNDTYVTVQLAAYEFAKVIKISKSALNMAADVFENWIVDILSKDIARAIEDYIINDASNGLTAATTVQSTKINGTYTYGSIMNLIGALPAGYDPDACFLMNKKTLWDDVKGIVGTDNRPVFDPDKATLCGYPVLVTDYLTSAKSPIYLGDFSQIVGNLASPIEVERNDSSSFESGQVAFRGWAEFDSKVANADGFVKLYKS